MCHPSRDVGDGWRWDAEEPGNSFLLQSFGGFRGERSTYTLHSHPPSSPTAPKDNVYACSQKDTLELSLCPGTPHPSAISRSHLRRARRWNSGQIVDLLECPWIDMCFIGLRISSNLSWTPGKQDGGSGTIKLSSHQTYWREKKVA